VAEAGLASGRGAVWIVDELDGDELIAGKLQHGEVADAGLRDLADDLVTHGCIEGERVPP